METTQRIVAVHGDRGGVGKSTTVRALMEFMRGHGRNPHVFEADNTNGHTAQAYQSAIKVDLHGTDGWDQITICATPTPRRDIVIDLPANIGSYFDAYAARLQDQLAFEGPRPRIVVLFVMEPTETSIAQLRAAMESDRAQAETRGRASWIEWVAVKNMGKMKCNLDEIPRKPHLASNQWQLWSQSETREMLLANGGYEIELPILSASVAILLEEGKVSPATILGDPVTYSVPIRSGLHCWLTAADRQFSVVFG